MPLYIYCVLYPILLKWPYWDRLTDPQYFSRTDLQFSALDRGNSVSSETVQSGNFYALDTGNAVSSETVQSGKFYALDTGNAVSSETVRSGKFSTLDTGNAVNSETVQSGNRSLKIIQGHWLKIIQRSSPEGNKCDLPACPPGEVCDAGTPRWEGLTSPEDSDVGWDD